MELNVAQIEALTRFTRVENALTEPHIARIHMGYLGLTLIELADILQRGYVIMVDKSGVYSLTDGGRRELDRLRNPPDEAAEIRAEIARLETALAAAKGRLEALMGEGE